MKLRRINISKSILLATLFTATLATGAGNAHASLGLDFSASAPYENGGPTTFGATSGYTIVGWSFRPNVDLYLNKLGIYDGDVDRKHQELHQVGIWSSSNQLAPLVSVSISEYTNTPSQSPQGGYFHFADVSNVVLKAGQTYFVGATLYTGTATGSSNTTDFDTFASIINEVPVTVNSKITYLGNAYGFSQTQGQLAFPNLTYSDATYTVGANIDVTPTPIPAAAWLLGSGLMGLVGIRRRTGK